MSRVRWIGLDVHAETIAAEASGEIRALGGFRIGRSIRRIIELLGPLGELRVGDEGGATGYVAQWRVTALGVRGGRAVAGAVHPIASISTRVQEGGSSNH